MTLPPGIDEARESDLGLVGRYLALGLRMGKHIEGLVDAYYGPAAVARVVASEPVLTADRLLSEVERLIGDLDSGELIDGPAVSGDQRSAGVGGLQPSRRRWLRSQLIGLEVTARKLAGHDIGYVEEVEQCYGVTPRPVPEDRLREAHRHLEVILPGKGRLRERYSVWRESHAVDPSKILPALTSLAEDLRDQTTNRIGLPEGESIEFALVTAKPWSGFNIYLGDLTSRVEINVDLPVLSTSMAHLVAHEAYPGHHTEHTRKEVGLVRSRRWLEETIFLVGTPQCLMAEGLADLGLEVLFGSRPEARIAAHLRPLGIHYDSEVIAQVAEAGEVLSAVRSNAAWRLHHDHADPEVVVAEVERWGLLNRSRAEKAVEFLTHPTWRSYISCYVEGLGLCRSYTGGDVERFKRLVSEQMIPADLMGV